MADGIANKYLKDHLITSAGTLPEPVNPNAINALNEIGIDISNNKSKKIDIDKLNDFDLVITLCGDAKDKCPVINSNKHIHWDIPDPAKFQGSEDQIRIEFSRIRDIIYDYIILLKEQLNKDCK
tara:strand:- start:345 stop:716 length:372 start_codon:yes stop_codon:yes gene_type:complete